MNILADPLVISATQTIGSGLVIIAGDDLGPGAPRQRWIADSMDSRRAANARSQEPGTPLFLYHEGLRPL